MLNNNYFILSLLFTANILCMDNDSNKKSSIDFPVSFTPRENLVDSDNDSEPRPSYSDEPKTQEELLEASKQIGAKLDFSVESNEKLNKSINDLNTKLSDLSDKIKNIENKTPGEADRELLSARYKNQKYEFAAKVGVIIAVIALISNDKVRDKISDTAKNIKNKIFDFICNYR